MLTSKSAYYGLHRSSSDCIHFVRNDDVDDDHLPTIRQRLSDLQIRCAYVDYVAAKQANKSIKDCIGELLSLEHAPYRGPYGVGPWVPFLDDLISLSDVTQGMVIVIDNADLYFAEARDEVFELMEAFLIPLHHWLEKKKPCHLCFQLEENVLVRQAFQPR